MFFLSTTITIYLFTGGSLSISTRFKDGDVSFKWNGSSSDSYDGALPGLRGGAFNVNGINYTVENAIGYESITFDVKAKRDTNYSRIIYKGTYSIFDCLMR